MACPCIAGIKQGGLVVSHSAWETPFSETVTVSRPYARLDRSCRITRDSGKQCGNIEAAKTAQVCRSVLNTDSRYRTSKTPLIGSRNAAQEAQAQERDGGKGGVPSDRPREAAPGALTLYAEA